MAINGSLINIARKLEDVFQPPEQCCSETGFQQQWREREGWAGLSLDGAWAISGRDGTS